MRILRWDWHDRVRLCVSAGHHTAGSDRDILVDLLSSTALQACSSFVWPSQDKTTPDSMCVMWLLLAFFLPYRQVHWVCSYSLSHHCSELTITGQKCENIMMTLCVSKLDVSECRNAAGVEIIIMRIMISDLYWYTVWTNNGSCKMKMATTIFSKGNVTYFTQKGTVLFKNTTGIYNVNMDTFTEVIV